MTNENAEIKNLYFNDNPKMVVTPELVINLLEDESNKFHSEHRAKFEQQLTANMLTQPRPLDFTYTDRHVDFREFMSQFVDLLNKNRLLFPHPERETTSDGKPVIWDTLFLDKPFDVLSQSQLYEMMHFDPASIEDLKLKHRIVTGSLPLVKPTELYHSNGYVMIGGGMYTWYAFLAIQALRKTGARLPLELIIPKQEDREGWLCDELLPVKYNVKCVTFDSIFGPELLKKMGELKGYQFKSFALLGSSFRNVMYLDSDNFAVKNPDYLFESDLYKRYKMITWPDFWRRTSSPSLYSVLGIKVGSLPVRRLNDMFTSPEAYYTKDDLVAVEERVNYHDRSGTLMDWSTESGQFLFDKEAHFNTLLLSLYYNYDGPAGYHPLLSQGGAGEGDKETYVLAAHFLKKVHYQVYRKPDKLYGSFIKDSNWYVDSTIVQMDPVVDYNNLKQIILKNQQQRQHKDSRVYSYDYTYGSFATSGNFKSVPMFYHIHAPKINPFEYVEKDLFTNMEDEPIRNFGNDYPKIGYDLELMIWQTIIKSLCEDQQQFKCFEGLDIGQICNNSVVDERVDWLNRTGRAALDGYLEQTFLGPTELNEEENTKLDDMIYGKFRDSLNYTMTRLPNGKINN
ncbi:hypothetical protein FOA43_003753 [Brettanomyces nanus]|uniref:Uncharacterized protein n=1 Tax=Eeniella nana TaxID=13502 RepID=A0A875S7X8_EENNA|nr:uncharacterized protein FOA43_003753 [Brettanomyces nanus]QPG76365.1 hypothetical protein FOA43_003753 [Brettanomyces nanus]